MSRRLDEVGQALGGVGDGDAAGGGGHGRQARRIGQDAGQGRGQAIDGQVIFQNDLGRARIGQGLRMPWQREEITEWSLHCSDHW